MIRPAAFYTYDQDNIEMKTDVPHPCVYFGWWLCEILGAVRHWMLRAEKIDSPYEKY